MTTPDPTPTINQQTLASLTFTVVPHPPVTGFDITRLCYLTKWQIHYSLVDSTQQAVSSVVTWCTLS